MYLHTRIHSRCNCPPPSPLTLLCTQPSNCARFLKHPRAIYTLCPVCRRILTPNPPPFTPPNTPYQERLVPPERTQDRREKAIDYLNRDQMVAKPVQQLPYHNGDEGRGVAGAQRGYGARARDINGVAAGGARRKRMLSIDEMLNPIEGGATVKREERMSADISSSGGRDGVHRVRGAVGKKRSGLVVGSRRGRLSKRLGRKDC